MSIFLASFLASFLFIFLRAFQQKNVQHNNYWLVIPTSFLMALCEVYVIANIAKQGYGMGIVFAIGLGGGLGCISSMWVHNHLYQFWKLVNKPMDFRPL